MARDPKYDILFDPVRIGPHTARNRFWQAPQCSGFGTDRPGMQAGHRAMKAEGGYGVVFTELICIAPETAQDPWDGPELWDANDAANLRLMVDAVHEHGALAGAELGYHRMTSAPKSRQAAYGVMQTNSDWVTNPHGGSHRTIEKEDLKDVRRTHVEAAKRARDVGFDLVSFHIAHGASLMVRFLTPFYNRRTDEYGGSFENRARLAREIMEEVHEAIGDDCAVGMRFSVDTLAAPFGVGEEGISSEEGFRFMSYMDDVVDYWDLVVGGGAWGEDAGSSRSHPENHEAAFTMGAKDHTSKPVINVGRFTSPDTMVKVIRSGQADIIGQARPSIADPFLPNKIKEGNFEDIRECIGCNICVSRWEQGSGATIICTQNATSGEEFRRGWHPERYTPARNRENNVLIVGAGPAGMECAMVLGKRGMANVHLVDAATELGGSLRWISQLPGRGEWGRVIDYRQIQLDKLENVTFIRETCLDADAVIEYGAEIVIIATGSRWDADGTARETQAPLAISDAARAKVLTPEDLMVHQREPGQRVVIYDADNYYMGVGLAEKLAKAGRDVTIITPVGEVAPYTEFTLEHPRIVADLRGLGVRMLTHTTVGNVGDATISITAGLNGDKSELPYDNLVLVTQRWSEDDLYQDLRRRGDDMEEAGITGLYRIGDCVAPTFIAEAIFDGHRLGREIDSPNPCEPLPFVRERRVVNADESAYVLPSPPVFDDVRA
jgi:dimethylamine/trimethylamine dehydrogenase